VQSAVLVLIVGIDPGSTATGLAAVTRRRGRVVLVGATVVRTRTADGVPARLHAIHTGIEAFLIETQAVVGERADAVAIEQIFLHRSAESALRLGQARGVALLAAAQAGLPVAEYNAMTIKKTVAGHGRAKKDQVGLMVQRLLGLDKPLASDAADAAAIALTHFTLGAHRARLAALAAKQAQ
jgi:crossover junction endodeoxyribonuclease RuvC